MFSRRLSGESVDWRARHRRWPEGGGERKAAGRPAPLLPPNADLAPYSIYSPFLRVYLTTSAARLPSPACGGEGWGLPREGRG
jgi:hypothetical protein